MQVAALDEGLGQKVHSLTARYRRLLTATAVVAIGIASFFACRHLLSEFRLGDLRASLKMLSYLQIGISLAFTAVSYLLLTLYDVAALRVIDRPLPYRTAAFASFTSYTLSHNLGLALLTGGSARYRVYKSAGLSTADVARVVGMAGVAFWGGIITTAAVALVSLSPVDVLGRLGLSQLVSRWVGVVTLVGVAAALLTPRTRSAVGIFGWTFPLPTPAQAAAQIVIAAADLAVASAALLVLVHGAKLSMFAPFYLGYALAIIVSLVTHVPGGVGVFEAVVVATVPDVPLPALVAALFAYRVIYYLIPLALAFGLLALAERRRLRRPLSGALTTANAVASVISPPLLAALVFLGGLVLLVSGALPPVAERVVLLRAVLPLPFVEASQIAASLVGTALLLLSYGLFRRLDAACYLTRTLLIAGALFSIAKGFDYEEATVLIVIAMLLHWTRTSFYRRSAVTAQMLTRGWIAAAAVAFALSLGIGFFVYRNVGYQHELWWRFAWNGDSSRFIRASFAAAVLLVGVIYVRVNRAAVLDRDDERYDPRPALAGAARSETMLALTGDKRFVGSADAFAMYQVQGRSWIVMGDPVGLSTDWPALLWTLRERADAASGRLLLYQITPAAVALAIDLGLTLVKYGEEARVDLAAFTVAGPLGKGLRHAERRVLRAGGCFEIIPAHDVPAMLAELRAVSNAWLEAKGQAEKSFSVGRFDGAYLTRFPAAVVRAHGKIVAFANIWATEDGRELSVDLMRHLPDAPYGTMDFLFTQLMQWGRNEGYAWFSLGVAPLSGLADRRLAPWWSRAGAFIYRHGEPIYGFDGLRAFKQKFSPVWEPRYVAGPPGPAFVRALVDLQTLINGRRSAAARVRQVKTPA